MRGCIVRAYEGKRVRERVMERVGGLTDWQCVTQLLH